MTTVIYVNLQEWQHIVVIFACTVIPNFSHFNLYMLRCAWQLQICKELRPRAAAAPIWRRQYLRDSTLRSTLSGLRCDDSASCSTSTRACANCSTHSTSDCAPVRQLYSNLLLEIHISGAHTSSTVRVLFIVRNRFLRALSQRLERDTRTLSSER